MSNNKMKILTNGLINENPVLRLVLGTCPTLAVTTMAANGIGMGLAATFVLICSNMVISALRNIIPGQVRIPCYITVIAGFVSVVQMLVKAFENLRRHCSNDCAYYVSSPQGGDLYLMMMMMM